MIDEVGIELAAGSGGSGSVSYCLVGRHRKKRPSGGSGGKGSSIYIQAQKYGKYRGLGYLYAKNCFTAPAGGKGGTFGKKGKNPRDTVIKVPLGTEVCFNHKIVDLTQENQRVLVAKGGEGGRGNGDLINSKNPQPDYATPPKPGENVRVVFKLKTLGDIGLIGPPNVGKSSILNSLTGSHSKVGNYSFTTLYPSVGVLRHKKKHYRIVDLPGLAPGAREGRGLGNRFLRHCERVPILVLVLDSQIALEQYNYISREIPNLLSKIKLILLNKAETLKNNQLKPTLTQIKRLHPYKITISAISLHKTPKKLRQKLIGIIVDQT
jgi:GTP-binding protein